MLVPAVAVGATGTPVKAGEANGAYVDATVAALAGVNVNAVVTSLELKTTAPVRVLNEATPVAAVTMAEVTNAVVAICVVLVPAVAVGATGVPVKAGEANGAYVLRFGAAAVIAAPTNAVDAACVVDVPAVAVGTVGVPVSAGLANGANVDDTVAVLAGVNPNAVVTSELVRDTAPKRLLNDTTSDAWPSILSHVVPSNNSKSPTLHDELPSIVVVPAVATLYI